jgi:hypothetical protein
MVMHFYLRVFDAPFTSLYIFVCYHLHPSTINTTWTTTLTTQWLGDRHITNISEDDDDLATTNNTRNKEWQIRATEGIGKWGPKHIGVQHVLGRCQWVHFFSYITILINILFIYRCILLPVTTRDAWTNQNHWQHQQGLETRRVLSPWYVFSLNFLVFTNYYKFQVRYEPTKYQWSTTTQGMEIRE